MTCWRCGVSLEPLGYHEDIDEYELPAHKPWCSMPGGCGHCGWSPHRWWCATGHVYRWTDPSSMGHAVIVKGAA